MRTIAILLLLASPCLSAEIHSKHLPYGLPTGTPATNDLIFRSCYVLSSNDTTKFADWVSYKLTRFEVSGKVDLKRVWRKDPLLDDNETLEPSGPDDYKGAWGMFKYQRGHLAPIASFKGSPYASEVNYYSNIVPQKGPMNGGPWSNLEGAVRKLVIKNGTVWVTTGTIYKAAMDDLPGANEPHKVPSALWKVVIAKPKGEGLKVAAFIVPQSATSATKYLNTLVKISKVEEQAEYKLFPSLPDSATLKDKLDVAWVATW